MPATDQRATGWTLATGVAGVLVAECPRVARVTIEVMIRIRPPVAQ